MARSALIGGTNGSIKIERQPPLSDPDMTEFEIWITRPGPVGAGISIFVKLSKRASAITLRPRDGLSMPITSAVKLASLMDTLSVFHCQRCPRLHSTRLCFQNGLAQSRRLSNTVGKFRNS